MSCSTNLTANLWESLYKPFTQYVIQGLTGTNKKESPRENLIKITETLPLDDKAKLRDGLRKLAGAVSQNISSEILTLITTQLPSLINNRQVYYKEKFEDEKRPATLAFQLNSPLSNRVSVNIGIKRPRIGEPLDFQFAYWEDKITGSRIEINHPMVKETIKQNMNQLLALVPKTVKT